MDGSGILHLLDLAGRTIAELQRENAELRETLKNLGKESNG